MYQRIDHTPFGWIGIIASDAGLAGIQFLDDDATPHDEGDDVSRETWRQIKAWCAGERYDFDLPFALNVSPEFRAWLDALSQVPYGTTETYGGLARRHGKPQAPRAAGSACARNPLPIIIPCHRITRHDGSLGNYGGIEGLTPKNPRNLALKQALIDHEKRFRT